MKYYIGIDNGVSGSICFLSQDGTTVDLLHMPVKKEQSYTKTKKNVSRIDHVRLNQIFESELVRFDSTPTQYICKVVLERPMVNPGRFQATSSALRALEATLVILEQWGLPIQYVDSKQWQKVLLPSGLKGPELKKASLDIGNRLFPSLKDFKHPDRDGLLIAEYARRMNW